MSDHAPRWRRAAVRPILEAYSACDAVDATMVSGSVARSDADRWSDTEVGVFWSRPPTAEERIAVAHAVHAADIRTVTTADANPPWYDHIYLGAAQPKGLLVEVVHTLTTTVNEILDAVLESNMPNPASLDVIKGIVDGDDVGGTRAGVVARRKSSAADYPRGLAVAVVQNSGAIEQFWRWRMLIERDNPLLLAREFTRIASQLLNVLHALNGRYCGHPSAFKRLDTLEKELSTAPPALARRLRDAFTLSPPEGADILRKLVEETYDLVEIHLPEIDVARLRALFRSDRQPLDDLPTTFGAP